MSIIGDLDNLAQVYEQLPHPAWRTVFTWLTQIPLSDQNNTFINPNLPTIKAYLKTIPTTKSSSDKYESHMRHIDVHICLSGSEIIQVVPVDGLISVSR